MLPPTSRVNYFEYQFVHVDDFTVEQAYHRGMRHAHNRMMHSWGVVQGLELRHVGSTVVVSEGVALDDAGREVVLARERTLDVPQELAGTTAYLTIAYDEKEAGHTTETGAPGDPRVEEEPEIRLTTAPPDKPGTHLVLGRVTVGAAGLVAKTDGGDVELGPLRRVAGPAPFVKLEAKTLSVKGTAAVDGHLTASGALTVTGTATLRGPVTVGNRLTVSGGIGFHNSGTADQRLYAPAGGTLRWQTTAAAPTHALELGVGLDAVRVHLDAKGPSYLTGGRLGVGVDKPAATLHVAGGTTTHDVIVGTEDYKLQIGVEASGTARLRAEGGVAKLVLGAAGADVLTVDGTGVQIGSGMGAIEGYRLSVIGTLDATELWQNGSRFVSSQWSTATKGIGYTGNVGIGGAVRLTSAIAGVTDRNKNAWATQGLLAGEFALGVFSGKVSYPVRVNLKTGNIGLHADPDVSGGASLVVKGDVKIEGTVTVGGRLSQENVRWEVSRTNFFSVSGGSDFKNIPDMIVTLEPGWYRFFFSMGGVYLSPPHPQGHGRSTQVRFLLGENDAVAYNNSWIIDEPKNYIHLHGVGRVTSPTSASLVVQWYGDTGMTLNGCFESAARSLIAIRL
jgi:hypothetical protein